MTIVVLWVEACAYAHSTGKTIRTSRSSAQCVVVFFALFELSQVLRCCSSSHCVWPDVVDLPLLVFDVVFAVWSIATRKGPVRRTSQSPRISGNPAGPKVPKDCAFVRREVWDAHKNPLDSSRITRMSMNGQSQMTDDSTECRSVLQPTVFDGASADHLQNLAERTAQILREMCDLRREATFSQAADTDSIQEAPRVPRVGGPWRSVSLDRGCSLPLPFIPCFLSLSVARACVTFHGPRR